MTSFRMKSWIVASAFLATAMVSYGQEKKEKDKHPENWFNLDLKKDGVFGVSTERAYEELLRKKKPKQKVLVAIIDSGVDTAHQDLKSKIWINPKEIPNNGLDDDGNGYVDDVHGWSFLGSKKGNLTYDNVEMVRLLRHYKPKYEGFLNENGLDSVEKNEFKLYRKLLADYGEDYGKNYPMFGIYQKIKTMLDAIKGNNSEAELTEEMVKNYAVGEAEEARQVYNIIKGGVNKAGAKGFDEDIKQGYEYLNAKINYQLNMDYDDRAEWIGDNYDDPNQRDYGNNDVKGPDAFHGTHVAGIIGADRNNSLGIKGIANNVELMSIRTVPDGDERDKDVANAIRYAVDNGAKVVNMSFGKGYKWDKRIVDEAVKYAEEKGVLLVHAAGNDNKNNDVAFNYPTRYMDSVTVDHAVPELNTYEKEDKNKLNRPMVNNWIEVGASDYKNDDSLKASFSNYGKNSVDVFAPGVAIHSTVPDSKYKDSDGTSMASPVVAGVAALLLSYYPDLKPADVRDIIMKSAVKVTQNVKMQTSDGEKVKAPFTDLCITGGVVNVYEALKMAQSYRPGKKK